MFLKVHILSRSVGGGLGKRGLFCVPETAAPSHLPRARGGCLVREADPREGGGHSGCSIARPSCIKNAAMTVFRGPDFCYSG